MDVQPTPIENIQMFDKNPRRISDTAIDKVAASIDAHGFMQPIVLDQNNRVCIGHTRLLAAKKLKMDKVPVVIKEMTEEQFKALNIADNKTGEFSKWDYDLLGINLRDIDSDTFMLSTGFSDEEILSLIDDDDVIPTGKDIDQVVKGSAEEVKYEESHVRTVILYLDQSGKDALLDSCQKIMDKNELESITDAITLAVSNEADRCSEENN